MSASVQSILPSLQFNEFINWIILRFEPLKDKHLSPSHSGYPRFRRAPRYICKFRSEFGVMVSHSFLALRLFLYYRARAQVPPSRGSNELMGVQLDGADPNSAGRPRKFIKWLWFHPPPHFYASPWKHLVVGGHRKCPGRSLSAWPYVLLERTPPARVVPAHSRRNSILISFDLISRYLASQASCPEADFRDLPVPAEIVAVADKRINTLAPLLANRNSD